MNGFNTDIIGSYTVGPYGIVSIINDYLIPALVTAALVVFLYGVAQAYIFSGASDAARAKGHQLIQWGIIGLVVMLSVWGIVYIVAATFGLVIGGAPLPPPQI